MKRHGLDASRAVRVLACVVGTGADRDPSEVEKHITARVARRAYDKAGIGPEDVSVAEVHDATAMGEIIQIENLGFCAFGEGGPVSERGETAIGGRIPVNTSGGLESKGHPVGATGLSQVHELVAQLRGEAGRRQVEGARIALAENGGGLHGDRGGGRLRDRARALRGARGMNLTGKVAVVTGAASGLGLATCKALAEAGARIVGFDRDEARLGEMSRAIGEKTLTRVVDVADEESVEAGIQAALERFGTLHVAVNCAGVADAAKTLSKGEPFPIATWSKVIAINLTGTFNVIRFAAKAMAGERARGRRAGRHRQHRVRGRLAGARSGRPPTAPRRQG